MTIAVDLGRKATKQTNKQIRGDSWDSGPVWNRGIKQYFLHILSLEIHKNLSWISGRWRMNVLVYICFHDQSPGNNGLWLGRNGTHEPLMNSWACLRLSYGTQQNYTLIWTLPIAWRCTTGLISVVDTKIALWIHNNRYHSKSVIECLTQNRGVADSSLTGATALYHLARHIYPCLILVQPRKTRPDIAERLLTAT